MRYYIVNAFSAGLGNGNPAGVIFTDEKFFDEDMLAVASALNLSETAFVRPVGNGFELRWFTPQFEIDLCGHATLAAAYVMLEILHIRNDRVTFDTKSGSIFVRRLHNGRYEITLPKRKMIPYIPDKRICDIIGLSGEYYSAREIFVCLRNESEVSLYRPDYDRLQSITDYIGVVITAPGNKVDFVSRYFCTGLKIEDPVTGSSHSNLVPFWANKLRKNSLISKQLSERCGTLWCENRDDDITIAGTLFPVLVGDFSL